MEKQLIVGERAERRKRNTTEEKRSSKAVEDKQLRRGEISLRKRQSSK